MRSMRALSLGAPLVLCGAASADVTLMAVKKDVTGFEDYVALVVNVYVVMDGTEPFSNFLTGVGGLPGMEGHVTVEGGFFFQSPNNDHAGGRLAPPAADIPMHPELAVDSFVTIGYKTDPGHDATQLSPGFPAEGGLIPPFWTPTLLPLDDAAWFVTPDGNDQAHTGHADNGLDTVLIGQFSIAAGADPDARIFGELLVQGVNDGRAFMTVLPFVSVIPAPSSLLLLATAGMLGKRRRRSSIGLAPVSRRERRSPCGHAS